MTKLNQNTASLQDILVAVNNLPEAGGGGGGGGDISLETCEVIVDASNLMAPEMVVSYSALRDGRIEYCYARLNMGDVVTITALKNTLCHACAAVDIACTGGLITVYSAYSEEGVYLLEGDGMLICY